MARLKNFKEIFDNISKLVARSFKLIDRII